MDFFTLIIGLLAYLIGAIPTGYLIAKLNGIADIRAHGSGNIGATNVSRFLGKHYFFIIFFLDAGKAFLFLHIIQPHFDYNYMCLFAALLLFGNGYSIFLQGSGGKGVATLCGLVASLYPMAIPPLLCIWAFILFIIKTVGIASATAALCLPLYAYTTHNNPFFLFSLFATVLIIWKHKPNIRTYWNNN